MASVTDVYRVDRDNFDQLVDTIVQDIKAATFFGFDLEFTALSNDDQYKGTLFDDGEERYRKLRLGLEGVAIHQFGLALFTMNAFRHYEVKCYNFYLCPRSCPDHDPEITFSSSSLLFNRVNDQRFHHSFEKGISYVDKRTESSLKRKLPPTQFNEIVGFTRIFREIQNSKKPFVGHNCFTDLLLIHAAFVGPLPEKYLDGKKSLKRVFGEVYDTKHVSYAIKSSVKDWKELGDVVAVNGLGDLHAALEEYGGRRCDFPAIGTIPSFEGTDASKAHEAGYDAYMAASVFLRCACLYSSFLQTSQEKQGSRRFEPMSFKEITFAVRSFVNKLNVIRAQVQCICLDGPDVATNRPQLYVATPVGNNAIGGLSQAMARFGSADVQLIGERKAVIAATTMSAPRNIVQRLNGIKQFKVRKYFRLLDDHVWSKVGLAVGLFSFVAGVIVAVPLK